MVQNHGPQAQSSISTCTTTDSELTIIQNKEGRIHLATPAKLNSLYRKPIDAGCPNGFQAMPQLVEYSKKLQSLKRDL